MQAGVCGLCCGEQQRVSGLALGQQGDQGGVALGEHRATHLGDLARGPLVASDAALEQSAGQLDPAADGPQRLKDRRVQVLPSRSFDRLAAMPAEVDVELVDLTLADRGVGQVLNLGLHLDEAVSVVGDDDVEQQAKNAVAV